MDALRGCGYVVHPMCEVYGEKIAQHLPDVVWIKRAAEEGWVIFTKDPDLRELWRPEYAAVIRHKARVFSLPDCEMREAEQIERYEANRYRIAQRAAKPGPYNYRVNKIGLDDYFDHAKAKKKAWTKA